MRVFKDHSDLEAALALPETDPAAFRFIESRHGPAGFVCADHGGVVPFQWSGGTGYAIIPASDTMVCYACSAKRERADLIERGKGHLYLTGKPRRVTDWTGQLSFAVTGYSVGRHNMAGKRYDVTFRGPDGAEWSGVTYGDNTQICHVRRLKRQPMKRAA